MNTYESTNYKTCCGEETYHPTTETVYCQNCDEFATVMAGIEWEDASVTAIDADGMLTEDVRPSPYAEGGKRPSLAEIAVFAAVVVGLFVFGWGLQIAEGVAK